MKYVIPRGTRDILPDEVKIWQYIENTFQRVCLRYNYQEIRTPIFESTDLFTRSIGSTTDIVTKEMYTFTDKGNRSMTLRPEETAPVIRACLQNGLIEKDRLLKLYYLGPMFRYERPQAGRFRQFHQAGIEAIGTLDPLLDVEVIVLGIQLFEELGLKALEVDINSVGCKVCRPEFQKKLKEALKKNLKNLCEDCQQRFEYNPLRVLDCKKEDCQKYIRETPTSLETLCPECRQHFEKVLKYLDEAGIQYKLNRRLVRGLDYYTKTTFEIVSKQLGAQNAICGGGRYDTLVEELGGPPTPATGFAVGLERLIIVMQQQGIVIPDAKPLKLFVAPISEEARRQGFKLLSEARKAGVYAEMDYLAKSLKSQMKVADKLKAEYTLIIGDEELKKGKGVLRRMADGTQSEIPLEASSLLEAFR